MTPPRDPSNARVETVTAAAEQWRHELVELGGRNRLLWHHDLSQATFDLTVAHPGGVAKLLSGRATLLSELVRDQLARTGARAQIEAIHAKTVELRTEHGLTCCFIAIGMATWRLHRAATPPRAPVLMRGVQVHPVDVTHQDFVLQMDRAVVFNPVLEHYLRGEVGLDIDADALARLSGAGGFDPRETYDALKSLCSGMDGFTISRQTVIGTYPWAKRDLVAQMSTGATAMAGHDLLAALAGHPWRPSPGRAPGLDAHEPSQELSVLDADAAQREVISEVLHGASLVLDTPTGTGATQTVTNVVAGTLAQGRSALVVSEERSPLDALRGRLAHVGLDEVVLDLPEDPRRARVAIGALVTQLDAALAASPPELPQDPLPQWFAAREVLLAHEEGMHRVREPWGQSMAQTQAELARLAQLPHPPQSDVRLDSRVLDGLPAGRIGEIVAVLAQAAAEEVWQHGAQEDPWYGAQLPTEADAGRAQQVVQRLAAGGLSGAREEMDLVCRAAGLPEPLNLTQWRRLLDLLARMQWVSDAFCPEVYDAPLPDLIAAAAGRGADTQRLGTLTRNRLRRQVRALLRPGRPPEDLAARLVAAQQQRSEWQELAGEAARPHLPTGWASAQEAFQVIGHDLEWLQHALAGTPAGSDLTAVHLDRLLDRIVRLDTHRNRVPIAAHGFSMLAPWREAGLGPLIDDLARRGIRAAEVPAEVQLVYQASLRDHLDELHASAMPPTPRVAAAARQLRIADRDHLSHNVVRVRRALWHRLARAAAAHPAQVKALRSAASQGACDIRAAIARSPDIVLALRPVLVASPLVVPATVPEPVAVDLVVVEHAHRTRTARCAAALARGRQSLVVGDGLCYGPRVFSHVAGDPVEGHHLEDDAGSTPSEDGVSVLRQASSVLPVRRLSTHYRALDQRMVTPLSLAGGQPVDAFPGVWPAPRAALRVVANPAALVSVATAAVVDHLRHRVSRSITVLTDRSDVAVALRASIREAAREDPALRAALEANPSPEVMCLPVSRWSGPVRDRVIWVRGPEREVGVEDVATVLAAARRTVTVLSPDVSGVEPQSPGARMLQLLVADEPAGPGEADAPPRGPWNPLTQDLGARLASEGLTVHHGVGQGRHAVPLGIEDPQRPGRLLVAVDIDAHPRAATSGRDELALALGRDEVRLRPEQLARLGWAHTRVLSRNLAADPAREVAALVSLVQHASAARSQR